jgi:predicted amidophosphoribosyltransferase
MHVATFSQEEVFFPLPERLCPPCRLAPRPFERAVAFGGCAGALRLMIHALTSDGITRVAERLGALLASAILRLEDGSRPDAAFPLDEVLVVRVPLRATKLKQRRFNHAEPLARAAVRALRARRPEWRLTLATGLLERRKATQSQTGFSPYQRRANLRGVFIAPTPEQLVGRNVLLIGDIYTTGVTAQACSSVLRRAGAASVRVATLTRPRRENFAAPQLEKELPTHEGVAFWGPARHEVRQEQGASRPSFSANDGVANGTQAIRRNHTFWGRNVFGQSQYPRS